MTYYKGFDKDLKCRGMQFEVGKTYDTGANDEDVELCSDTAIHFCDSLQNVHEYYSQNPDANNRVCEVEPLGKTVSNNTKMGTNKIKILREITGEELAHLRGLERGNTGVFNTGDRNTGSQNTGSQNTGSQNTGSQNTGSQNTGSQNTGSQNTGDRNTGHWNTGNWNTGSQNTGHWNTGNQNTGRWNTGNWNTGSQNTGHWNTGSFNKCNHSTGFFNTQERTITIFSKDSGMTYDEFYSSKYYDALNSAPFVLTEWHEFTEAEKNDSVIRQSIGGKLISYTYEEACTNWWKLLSNEAKETIQNIPNFDAKIFKEITGIDAELERNGMKRE
jgi:hypothetical protein